MRRFAIILAGAALALSLVVPAVAAEAHGRGGHRGDHHGHSYSRHGHGGRCYGCDGPGSRCGYYGCSYAFPYYGYGYGWGYGGYGYGYGGYWRGGFGCNFDYPCGPPYAENDCMRDRAPYGKPVENPPCKAPGTAQPGPDQGATQPAPPDQSAQPAPAPDQSNTEPTPQPASSDQPF